MIKLKRSIMFLLKRKKWEKQNSKRILHHCHVALHGHIVCRHGKYLRAPCDDLARSNSQNAPNLKRPFSSFFVKGIASYLFKQRFHVLVSATSMATVHKTQRPKAKTAARSPILILFICISAIVFLCVYSSQLSTNGFSFSKMTIRNLMKPKHKRHHTLHDKYLYWGSRIDCPGKNCDKCAGLGHQESSLRCALEEAMFLGRYVKKIKKFRFIRIFWNWDLGNCSKNEVTVCILLHLVVRLLNDRILDEIVMVMTQMGVYWGLFVTMYMFNGWMVDFVL